MPASNLFQSSDNQICFVFFSFHTHSHSVVIVCPGLFVFFRAVQMFNIKHKLFLKSSFPVLANGDQSFTGRWMDTHFHRVYISISLASSSRANVQQKTRVLWKDAKVLVRGVVSIQTSSFSDFKSNEFQTHVPPLFICVSSFSLELLEMFLDFKPNHCFLYSPQNCPYYPQTHTTLVQLLCSTLLFHCLGLYAPHKIKSFPIVLLARDSVSVLNSVLNILTLWHGFILEVDSVHYSHRFSSTLSTSTLAFHYAD